MEDCSRAAEAERSEEAEAEKVKRWVPRVRTEEPRVLVWTQEEGC